MDKLNVNDVITPVLSGNINKSIAILAHKINDIIDHINTINASLSAFGKVTKIQTETIISVNNTMKEMLELGITINPKPNE